MKPTLLLFLTFLLAPMGGLAQKVNTEFDESADFSKYKTFVWKGARINSKHPSLDNSLVEKHIQRAVIARLTAKGLTETPDHPDLFVHCFLGARNQRDVELAPAGWRGRGTRRVAYRYTQGTLVIDLRDAARRELVWRATCVDTASDPAKIEKRIDNDVAKAFDKFPPKKK